METPIEGIIIEVEDDPTVSGTTDPTGAFTLAISASIDEGSELALVLDEEVKKKYDKYKSRTFNIIL